MQSHLPEVVIVGGGFGGLQAARALRRAPVTVTLVDRRNFHLFQPLLYQVATGALSPANIAAPLRALFKRFPRVRTVLGEVCGIDSRRRRIQLRDGELAYDYLILASGSKTQYFTHPEWDSLACGLKTLEDALAIRARILTAFELAEQCTDPARRREWLTFVIVGGGPTGVELCGALSEIAQHTLRREFRRIDPASARIVLVEYAATLLGSYPARLATVAADFLRRSGVEVLLNTQVVDLAPGRVEFRRASSGQTETLRAQTVLWTAGVVASPLGAAVQRATGCQLDRQGRVRVAPDLSVPGHPRIFVIGDLAHCADRRGSALPAIAPVAIQQGRHVSRVIRADLRGRAGRPFHYRHSGMMATIGRAMAVADLGVIKLSGTSGWLAWLLIHLLQLVAFESRVLVLIQWAWSYFTRNRSARLITLGSPDTSQAQSAAYRESRAKADAGR